MTVDTIAEIVRHHARCRPDEIALSTEHTHLTFADLDARSSRVAQALIGDGVQSQDRIAFLDKGGPEYFEVLFGGSKVNAVSVGVNWRLAAQEIAGILDDAEAKVLIVGQEYLPVVDTIEPHLSTVQRIIVIGEHERHPSYEAWLAPHQPIDPELETSPDDVALQLYTSGTTGLPKGVMLPNRSVFTAVPAAAAELGYSPVSTNLVAMPLFHVGGVGVALMGLYVGCRTVLMREVDLRRFLELVIAERVTHLFAVPAVLQFLLDEPDIDDMDYSALQTIVYGASPISVDVLERSMRTFGCRFIQTYGLTETHGTISRLRSEDHDPGGPTAHRLRSAGTPMPGVQIRTVDPDTGQDTDTGEVGEIWARTPQNMSGYWNQPDETAKAITPDGWLKTGDAGYFDEDGFLYIHDRIKDMIISGGENVYPAEVENVLMSHPAVRDVAVIGVPSERWGETVKAIVVPVAPRPGADQLIQFARDRLAHYKCPASVEFVDVLPRNPSGKIQKRELRTRFA